MNHVAIRPQHLDILSICTGGAGLDLGIELAIPGARTVCMVEREAFAAAQLVSAMQAGHLAPAPIWSDARTFDGRRWRGCVDGLIGGIPCQPHSLAGKRLEREDPRDLWSTARRIIVQSGAWFVLIENVGGMLSSGGAERVWRDLHRLGFASEGGLFTAAEVGASHERERLFILAVADRDDEHGNGRWIERSRWGRQSSDGCSDVADASNPRLQGRELGGSSGERDGAQAPRPTAELCGAPLADADRRFREQHAGARHDAGNRDEADRERAHNQPAGSGGALVDTIDSGRGRRQDEPIGSAVGRTSDEGAGGGGSLFPPGPNDLSSWRHTLERAPELEPAVRRVADGLASRLDIARVDRLRMLGNGVVPLAAAYAVRTLATRLAERGSTGAASLVRMMTETF